MAEEVGLRKLLILSGPAMQADGVIESLKACFDVQVAEDLDQALEAMRRDSFDAVLAETADFLPLERGVGMQQASVVLETLGEGVCIAGPGGKLVWANQRLREAPPEVRKSLLGLCARAYEELALEVSGGPERGRRFSLMPGDSYYEVICSPVRDRDGSLRQVAAVVIDATSQRRQQRKLNAIDRAGRELTRLDEELLREKDAPERLAVLEDRIIRYSRDVLDYEHFALLLLNERTNGLEWLISEGLSEAAGEYQLFASTESNGICGYVAATGRSYICPDCSKDPLYITGLEGARCSLTVPLRLHDKVVGVLNVESHRPGAFTEEDRQFGEIFGNYIAMALNTLNLLSFERRSARSQVSGSISAALAGPLNDIIAEATDMMEEYIGHDDIRRRLGTMIDRASQARDCVNQWAKGQWDWASAARLRIDPVLNQKRVLIADDEELIRQTLGDVLTACGCNVDLACNGSEALYLLEKGPYDLIISDIKMPGADGYEVFQAAKVAGGDAKVILMTAFGYDPNHTIVRANQDGVAAVVLKPFRVNQLLDECRAALTGR